MTVSNPKRRSGAMTMALAAVLGLAPIAGCAEIQGGVTAEASPRGSEARLAQAATSTSVSPFLRPAPELFEATGLAVWDGKRTLQGIWVAHPLAKSARRVRIFNSDNGQAVDGALFKRDQALGGASVLISSEAAQLLGMQAGSPAELRIVAVAPRQSGETPATGTANADEPAASDEASETTTAAAVSPSTDSEAGSTPSTTGPSTATQSTTTPETTTPETTNPATTTAAAEADADADATGSAAKGAAQDSAQAAAKPVEPEADKTRVEAAPLPTESTPKPKPAAPAKPKADPKPERSAARSTLRLPFVQAGIFGVKANADKLVRRIKNKNIPAEGKTFRSKGKTFTRVIAGPFRTSAERSAALREIRRMGLKDAAPVRR